jgi:DNA polymerase-4
MGIHKKRIMQNIDETILINHDKPLIMHIDLNSCFATIEQQANPLLRGKPIAVAAYSTPNAFILAPSIEAKRLGIRMGMRIRDAQAIYHNIVIRTPDPPKYRDVHIKFKKIFQDYSPEVIPKSIDEAIIDFRPTNNLHHDLVSVAKEIKQRMKDEIGEWIFCSIGIGTNMFLAKLGASFKKPDGLTYIDYKNLIAIYKQTTLLDLNGINVRYQARLNVHGIYTPYDFFKTSQETLHKKIFRSVIGARWYEKLRGYEADQREFSTKSIGHQYALHKPTADSKELSKLLMKLCEKTGRRLRRKGYTASGIHIGLRYNDHTYWHHGKTIHQNLYTTIELYRHAQTIFSLQLERKPVSLMSVTSYQLSQQNDRQLSIFGDEIAKTHHVSDAADKINDIYGEFTVVPGIMMDMDDVILDRIAFGGVREMEGLTTSFAG